MKGTMGTGNYTRHVLIFPSIVVRFGVFSSRWRSARSHSGNIYLEPSLHLPLHPAVSIPPSDTVASIPPSGTLVDAMVEKLPPPVRPV